MDKGKKQHNTRELLSLLLDAPVPLDDQQYLALGALLEGGRVRSEAHDLVLVDPCVPPRPRLSFRRTPMGMLAPTILSALGLEETLMDAVVAVARPQCTRCRSIKERGEVPDWGLWPHDGYVAVVVDGASDEISLEEQCELLGAERAIVSGTLLRVGDVAGRPGEPVIHIVEASHGDEAKREISDWFRRGGSALRLVHFSARDATGVDVQRLSREWRCGSCGTSSKVATRQIIEDLPECKRCRGEGWISTDDDRFLACDDCDAYGCSTPLASYEVAGVALKHLAAQPLRRVVESLPDTARQHLERVSAGALGEYPVGAALELLSKGERTLVTRVSAEISRVSGLTLVIDGGALGLESATTEGAHVTGSGSSTRILFPCMCAPSFHHPLKAGDSVITLRDLTCGPLSIDSLEIPIGRASVIQGGIGSGKSLLLHEIARRFAKRKKLAHLAAWGGLKRLHVAHQGDDVPERVGEVLGLDVVVATEMGRLRSSQERGLTRDDFVLARSKHVCPACLGTPHVEGAHCSSCSGALCDRRVGGVSLGSFTFADLMRLSLSEVGKVLWASDIIVGVVERLPEELKHLTLGDASSSLSPAVRRFLRVFAPLATALVGDAPKDGDLFLIDVPFGTCSSYQEVLIRCIKDLEARGATIVCSGVPKTLEIIFTSVVRLEARDRTDEVQSISRYFDARMARSMRVRIESEGSA